MFSKLGKTLEKLSLSKYKIVNNEPSQNVFNHIKNLYSQIPFHFKKKKEIEVLINTSFKDKAARNSSDYRESLLHVCNYLFKNHPSDYVISLLKTMCKIQEIFYLAKFFQKAQTVLRIYSVTF